MSKKLLLLSMIITLGSTTVLAKGIRYVEYQRDKIPNIITAAGIASEIIFEEDEAIEYATFGFDAAWESVIVRDHILVFKAKDPQPETNLIVHTTKRDYLFTVTTGNNEWEKHPNNAGAYYSVRMVYHDKQSKESLAAQQEQGILRNREISPPSTYIYTNYDYRATENANNIVPHRVWDNGTLTFIAFKAGSKRGVVYELDNNNKSNLVNQHTEKNGLLVVHGVYPKLIIRLGDKAVELRRNNQYGHRENNLKTNVERVLRYTSNNAPVSFKQSQEQELSMSALMLRTEPQEDEYFSEDIGE